MAQCTAPVYGHRSSAAAARCPACSSRYGRSYGSYSSYSPPRYPSYGGGSSVGGRSSGGGGGGGGGGTRRLRGGGTVSYTPTEWRTFEPVARRAEAIAEKYPDRRDLFLCHAWDDRESAAKELFDQLTGSGASVWFSETEVKLGQSLMREIDKGLRMSRIGIVLVTPAMLRSLEKGGIADKELSALLRTDRVIPVAHGVTFEDIEDVSPLLAARSGLTIDEALSMQDAARKVAAAAAAETPVDAPTETTSLRW